MSTGLRTRNRDKVYTLPEGVRKPQTRKEQQAEREKKQAEKDAEKQAEKDEEDKRAKKMAESKARISSFEAADAKKRLDSQNICPDIADGGIAAKAKPRKLLVCPFTAPPQPPSPPAPPSPTSITKSPSPALAGAGGDAEQSDNNASDNLTTRRAAANAAMNAELGLVDDPPYTESEGISGGDDVSMSDGGNVGGGASDVEMDVAPVTPARH